MISGLSNTHNIITISMFTLTGLSFIIIHFISIFNNRKIEQVEDTDDLPPPASILYLALVLTFWSSFGFYQSPALRKFGIKTVKSNFTVNNLRGLAKITDPRLFRLSKVSERAQDVEQDLVIEDLE